MFFFLPWTWLKKHIWAREDFLFWVLGWFFVLLKAIDWFNKALKIFHRFLGQELVRNGFLGEKTMNTIFLATLVAEFWKFHITHCLPRHTMPPFFSNKANLFVNRDYKLNCWIFFFNKMCLWLLNILLEKQYESTTSR